jgi:hypothetical protein
MFIFLSGTHHHKQYTGSTLVHYHDSAFNIILLIAIYTSQQYTLLYFCGNMLHNISDSFHCKASTSDTPLTTLCYMYIADIVYTVKGKVVPASARKTGKHSGGTAPHF